MKGVLHEIWERGGGVEDQTWVKHKKLSHETHFLRDRATCLFQKYHQKDSHLLRPLS